MRGVSLAFVNLIRTARRLIVAAVLGLLPWCGRAADSESPAVGLPKEPSLKPVGEGVFELGKVRLDKRARTVSFPAVVNMRDGPIEYAVVRQDGKTHESILRTDAQPQHIHIAMLLLGARVANTNLFPDPPAPPPGEPVRLEVAWLHKGQTNRYPLEELVLNRETRRPLERGIWIYNGSNVSEGGFTAQRDGSIISTHIDPDALVNNPRPGRENDDLYTANAKLLPVDDTSVTVTILFNAATGGKAGAAATPKP